MTLQQWMDERALKDEPMAKLIGGVTRSQISRIRRGVSTPQIPLANRLQELTGIPATSFFPSLRTDALRQDAA